MSVQHIWNLFQLLGLFTRCKPANLSWNFVTETCKQCPETTSCRLCCEKLGTSHDVKGFAICHWFISWAYCCWKTLKTLVWSAQNRLISSEICLENNLKIALFLAIAFWWSLPWNFPRNSFEIGRFFCEIVAENPARFDFFLRDLAEALR